MVIELEYTPPYGKNTAPTQVSVSKSTVAPSEQVTLSWNAGAAGAHGGIKDYEVRRAASQNGTYSAIGTTNELSMTVTASSTLAQTYYYKVVARSTVSSTYDSPLSSAYASVFSSPPSPSKPAGLLLSTNDVVPGATSSLSWDASTADPSNPISGYQVQRKSGTGEWQNLDAVQTDRSKTVTAQTTHNTSYLYRVIAVGQYSNSEASSSIELRTTVGELSPPANVKINNATSSTVSPATVTQITWGSVASATNNDVTGYEILSSSSASGTYAPVGEVAADVFTFDVTAPTTEQTVYYRIRAKGALANSQVSSFVSLVVSLTTADASTFTLDSTSVYAGDSVVVSITSNTEAEHKVKIDFFNDTSGVLEMAGGITS